MPRSTLQQKRTAEFNKLCRLHRTALEQAQRASEAGHKKIAAGVLRQAQAIQVKIEEHCREDTYHALVKQRGQIAGKLHAALAKGRTQEAKQLGQDLAALDCQIAAA